MRLVVVSHKLCWPTKNATSGFATDGGFPLQMEAISELFEQTTIVAPCSAASLPAGVSPLEGNSLSVVPLTVPKGTGLRRKVDMLRWFLQNGPTIWRRIRAADAVHAPIPGDVGTIGMIFALLQRKPLLVRHCGNWLVQKTIAERFWKWSMEYFAGGNNVMFATGGAAEPPSRKNPNLKWIFSTSLRAGQLEKGSARTLPSDGKLKLIIACRQEERKGTDKVIDSLPAVHAVFPHATLDVVGDGSLIPTLKRRVEVLGLDDHVTFHGRIEPRRVIGLLKQSHVFCYPTLASEGFPKVVLEALASGLPVISTRVSVLPKLLGSGAGVLLEKADSDHLARAVIELASDDDAYSRMSALAMETASEYSLEKWRDVIGAALRRAWNVRSLSARQTDSNTVLEHS